MIRKKYIVMLGTSLETKGGMASVVNTYSAAGLFDRWPIIYLSTHLSSNYFVKIKTVILALIRYIALLLRGRVAIVHVHSASNGSFWRKSIFILLAMLSHRPVIFHLHGGGFREFYNKQSCALSKYMIRKILNCCTRIVVISQSWKTIISGITSNPRIVVAPNPAQVVHITRESRERINGGYIVFLNRINEEKGIFDLLEALALIRKHIPDVRLKCAGDSGASAVMQRARELGVSDRIEILGWVQGDAKREVLEKAIVYVLPSYIEGVPMGILEAMSAGLPIVSTRVGGIPDVITDGVEGFLVTPGDVASLAKAIERLLKDARLRRSMGDAGQRKIEEHFLPEKALRPIEKMYEELYGG